MKKQSFHHTCQIVDNEGTIIHVFSDCGLYSPKEILNIFGIEDCDPSDFYLSNGMTLLFRNLTDVPNWESSIVVDVYSERWIDNNCLLFLTKDGKNQYSFAGVFLFRGMKKTDNSAIYERVDAPSCINRNGIGVDCRWPDTSNTSCKSSSCCRHLIKCPCLVELKKELKKRALSEWLPLVVFAVITLIVYAFVCVRGCESATNEIEWKVNFDENGHLCSGNYVQGKIAD